jgi:hypothetical protein
LKTILRTGVQAFIAAIAFAAATAGATPHQHDANDLWIVPNESGWGLNLFHQGDTLFGSLFVYGPDGKARWYTASSLVGDDGGPNHDRAAIYFGGLYESTGPAVGGAFDPARVTRRQVGTMSVELGAESVPNNPARSYANVVYDVDGVRVAKHAFPFSFVAMGLTGTYTGYQAAPGGMPEELNISVSLQNGSFAMTTTGTSSGSCTYSGIQDSNGSLFRVGGSVSCNNGRTGTFVLGNVDVTRYGFTAYFSTTLSPSSTGLVAQRTSSSKIRGDGYSTDLWWNAAESGWGLNIIEQGDTLFGTLFVYDAQGKPRWYSASNLAYEQCAPPDSGSDCRGRYRGALYESTGPYFGTVFNDAAVQRRQVGTMSIDFYANNTAYASYSIDGVTVTEKPLSRAAFRANALAGSYAGHILAGNNDRGMQVGAMSIDIAESGDTITVTMRGSRGTCTMRGRRSQYGREVVALGPYDCGGAQLGQLVLEDVYVTSTGFTGSVSFGDQPGVNVFSPIGNIEAVRTTAR